MLDKILSVGLWGWLGWCAGQVVGIAIIWFTIYKLVTHFF